MSRELLVRLCIDIEPNKKRFGGQGFDSRQPSPWNCHEVVFPFVREARERFEQETGMPLRYGWYVRADTCIAELYGRASWALEEFREALGAMCERGDDIHIHPHSWRWDERRHRWFQEVRDHAWLTECFTSSVESYRRVMGQSPWALHIGFDYVDNFLVGLWERLGIKMVMAPIPRVRHPGLSLEGSGRAHFFDWSRAPAHPYYPSRSDYQRPGPDAADLLFIPNTVVIQPWGSYLFHLAPFRNPKRLPRWLRKEEIHGYPDHSQPGLGSWRIGGHGIYKPKWRREYYYVPPSVQPFLMKKGVEAAINDCPGWERVPMAVCMAQDELLREEARNLFESDLRLLVREAEQRGFQLRFVTAKELYAAVQEELHRRGETAA